MESWVSYLIMAIVGGLIPAAIARRKGRDLWRWWVYGALLPFVALPHALFARRIERKWES